MCLALAVSGARAQDFFYEPIVGLSRSPVGFATGVFKVGEAPPTPAVFCTSSVTLRNSCRSVWASLLVLFWDFPFSAGYCSRRGRVLYLVVVCCSGRGIACGRHRCSPNNPRDCRESALAFDRRKGKRGGGCVRSPWRITCSDNVTPTPSISLRRVSSPHFNELDPRPFSPIC